ncbi:hypothetical protein [Rathayibacter sp. AY1E1]|uniref:hypothetical protein n=1 Tax=Rathayibacter sp. AY1E1 TaxID=2080549 RepID=UPI000CE7ABB6|nr:hypothetical protein [Rathayibacter sp. AY1E1]PPH51219.1 hypothetical protein C5C67_11935 [Rathayibacter sp. AY1E1]
MTKKQDLEAALAAEEIEPSCIRGCVRRGTEDDEVPEHLGARHGRFCDRCFFRTRSALRLAPQLAGHVASLVGTKLVGESAGAVAKDAPLPMNAQAFDDLNELYAILVQFAGLFAARLHESRPLAALQAWRNATGRVIGFPAGVSPWLAERETRVQSAWLDRHLEAIFGESAVSDHYVDVLLWFAEEAEHTRTIERRWFQTMKPRWSRMPHSDRVTCCWSAERGTATVAVFPPTAQTSHMIIRCVVCEHVWTEDEYEAELLLFEREQRAMTAGRRLTAHLMRKYSERSLG